MAEDRSARGSAIAALGAAVLAVSVFSPWYGVSLTASGVASAQQSLNAVAQQYGNSAFQSAASGLSARFGSLTGHQLGTLSAHDALKYLNIVLLILAAVALVASLLHLADALQPPRGQVALVGVLAAICVLFRMLVPPAPSEAVIALSLSWGIWLALAGSLAIVVGDVWPPPKTPSEPSAAQFAKAIDELSGWSPPA